MTIDQLIELRRFNPVVQSADVRSLRDLAAREPQAAAIADFVAGYLGHDERSNQALGTALKSLTGTNRGGAFFFNGVYGSGKSHLLGLLALLSERAGVEAFAEVHPALAGLPPNFAPRLVVHFSLDDYDPTRHSLEDVCRLEVEREWLRRKLPPREQVEAPSRTEQFEALDQALLAEGLHGLVLCVDELSLFLDAREHHALQGDAAFLQFLGQRAARAPLWIFAALQKTVEHIGELEQYSLAQIRDRYTTLPLSLAHLPSLIEHRLIVLKDPDAVHDVCRRSYRRWVEALPSLEFGEQEWRQLYPFSPATVLLLEQVVSRFFSRTRSAGLFCLETAREALAAAADAELPILPDRLFDYLLPELESHPDLRPLATVWLQWQENIAELLPDEARRATLTRLCKVLLLFRMAGTAPTVAQLAHAALLDAELPDGGNYGYAQSLLETLRSGGSYLVAERREGAHADRYSIDLGTRVAEMARRHTRNMVATLSPGDARISRYAWSCCGGEPLPLASLDTAASFPVMWRNAPRRVAVEPWQDTLTSESLSNRLALLAGPGHEDDLLLLVAPPFRLPSDERVPAADSVREAGRAVADTRWRSALLLWQPRLPVAHEVEAAREATAQQLLEADPQLLDNRRGRAILQYLQEGAPQRVATLAALAVRLLLEGQLVGGDGRVVEAGELAAGSTWNAILEAVAEFSFPVLFPQFETVAPRLRLLTPSNADALCLEILRRPPAEPFYSPSLERPVRAIAEPLGLARPQQGRWGISPLREDLKQTLRQLVDSPSGIGLTPMAAWLAKSPWGLTPPQTDLATCALLRSGEWAALDSRGRALPASQLGLPLSRAVHSLRPVRLLDGSTWERVRGLVQWLCAEALGEVSPGEQEKARVLLARWRETATAEVELAQARLNQLRGRLGATAAPWPRTDTAVRALTACLTGLDPEGTTPEFLQRAAALATPDLENALGDWKLLAPALDRRHGEMLAVHALLTNPDLVVPPELQETRARLLVAFDDGEALLEDEQFWTLAAAWRQAYAAQYSQWHALQNSPDRFAPYRRLGDSDELRSLDRLSQMSSRTFGHAAAVREAISTELRKSCLRSSPLDSAVAVCPSCRLRWGERLRLRDPGEIEAMIGAGTAALRQAVAEPAVQANLAADAAAAPVVSWSAAGPDAALFPLLTDSALQVIDTALRPRRQVRRSLASLPRAFSGCRNRADYLKAFTDWLDAGEVLGPEDEVVLDDLEGALGHSGRD